MALRLTMAFSDNPRVQPLKDGTVKPQNIELGCITLEPGALFHRNLAYDEFDVAEMSISETLLAFERRDGTRWDWSALPVFLSRGHHWHTLYVNTASGIASLADIKGKRIGVPDYDMTAALWFRITLRDLYGIEARDNIWFNGRTKELSHGGALGLDKAGPRGVTHHWLTVDQTLDVMLDRGEIPPRRRASSRRSSRSTRCTMRCVRVESTAGDCGERAVPAGASRRTTTAVRSPSNVSRADPVRGSPARAP